jgi:hypothetical protein
VGEGYKYPSPKTSHCGVKFRNFWRLQTQKLAVMFKIDPETPQKYPKSSDKDNIALFSEIFRISAKFSGIFETFGVSTKISGISGDPLDNLGDLRENTITFYSGL